MKLINFDFAHGQKFQRLSANLHRLPQFDTGKVAVNLTLTIIRHRDACGNPRGAGKTVVDYAPYV
jgi:hypothetical protein